MRFVVLLMSTLLVAGATHAHTFSLTVANNSSCGTGNGNHSNASTAGYPDGTTCFENSGLNDTNVAVLNDSGDDSATGGGSTTLSNTFSIDAAVAVDAFIGNNEYQELNVSYDLMFTIVTDSPGVGWDLTLDHDAAGLLGLHGDGTLSAVGTQNNGHAHMSAITISGDASASLATAKSYDNNPSNTSQSSQTFGDSAAGIAVASGTGDATVQVTVSFKLDAFSNDGCSGFICSSASGGEEAGVLFGVSNATGLGDVDVDEYSQWGRSVGPDGYNSTWTLALVGDPCGNGVLEGTEQCDDGNNISEDGCSDTCANEFCGDFVLQPGLDEQCDDGNLANGDGCNDICEFEVGVYVPLASPGMLMLLVGALTLAGVVLVPRVTAKSRS